MGMKKGTLTANEESVAVSFHDRCLLHIGGSGWSGTVKAQFRASDELDSQYEDLPGASFTENAIKNIALDGNWVLKLVAVSVTGTAEFRIGQFDYG